MALELLFSGKNSFYGMRLGCHFIPKWLWVWLICCVFFLSCACPLTARPQRFRTYQSLSEHTLRLFSGAQRRIWIATRIMGDHSLGTSLFLAGYRGLQVGIILSRKYITHPASIVGFIRSGQIPVKLVDDRFFSSWSGIIYVDDRLQLSDVPFVRQFKSKLCRFRNPTKSEYRRIFRAFQSGNFSKPHRLWAGSSGGRLTAPGHGEAQSTGGLEKWGSHKAYTYGRRRLKKPAGITGKLPKVTKWDHSRKGKQ